MPDSLIYEPTALSSLQFAENGNLEEWIHLFLLGEEKEGGNRAFSEGLKIEPRKYRAPALMSLGLFERCCGPEEGIKFRVSALSFNENVNGIINRYKNGGWDMPPLIVNCEKGKYELNDGNHRFEALKRMGISEYWVILWETDFSGVRT